MKIQCTDHFLWGGHLFIFFRYLPPFSVKSLFHEEEKNEKKVENLLIIAS